VVGALPWTPLGELRALTRRLAVGKGPKNPSPALGLRPRISPFESKKCPSDKFLATPMLPDQGGRGEGGSEVVCAGPVTGWRWKREQIWNTWENFTCYGISHNLIRLGKAANNVWIIWLRLLTIWSIFYIGYGKHQKSELSLYAYINSDATPSFSTWNDSFQLIFQMMNWCHSLCGISDVSCQYCQYKGRFLTSTAPKYCILCIVNLQNALHLTPQRIN